jgi:NAD(P)-dependent dehydrogenase (short-subunit alcohol dehydrogenase family)
VSAAAGQRILITGAASGLGLALARRYAADGWRVLLTDVSADALATAVAALAGTDGGTAGAGASPRIHGLVHDVRSDDDWATVRAWCEEHWDGLDVLVNNAGVATGGRFARLPMEDWDWILDINLKGVIRGCRTFVPLFEAQGSGHLVNVASLAGLLNPPAMASYNVVKASVVSLSETLRFELEPAGIRTSVVCPSFFRTGLAASFRTPDPAVQQIMDSLVTKSRTPAEAIAAVVQKGVAEGRFLILTDRDGRVAYFVKRFVPPLFRNQVRKGAGRLLGRIAAAEQAEQARAATRA